jgi:hypothetical protein
MELEWSKSGSQGHIDFFGVRMELKIKGIGNRNSGAYGISV